jgi:metallophosphoesterase superfamily enzyme
LSGFYEDIQYRKLTVILEQEAPDTIILNGDTFDLFFDMGSRDSTASIDFILSENKALIEQFNKVKRIFILSGAHDQAFRRDSGVLRGKVQAKLP